MAQCVKLLLAALLVMTVTVAAAQVESRDGWQVIGTERSHAELFKRLIAAVPQEGMGVVTQAGPTVMARSRGIEIPENRIVGVFNNQYAVDILSLSTAAMSEAPTRFYITEDPDGNATLSWKESSFVLAPYVDQGGDVLTQLAHELDARFSAIAARATVETVE